MGTSAGSVLSSLLGAGVSVDQLIDHQHGHPITEGPLAGYSWDYEKATGGEPSAHPAPARPGQRQTDPAHARPAVPARCHRPPCSARSFGRQRFFGTGRASGRGFHPLRSVVAARERGSSPLDYESGRRVAFGHENAPTVALSDAVAASCAIPGWFRPMQIDGRTYIDGGAWSATSADLLAGLDLDEVYVLAPMLSFAMDQPDTMLGRVERRWRVQVTKRCLERGGQGPAGGADVVVLGPGPEDLEAMGANVMDNSRRIAALETSLKTSVEALRDPDKVGPDHLADVS